MKLLFYCDAAPDHTKPFVEGCEVLLSVSIIRDSEEKPFTPAAQTGQGFMDMVETIIGNPNITGIALLNTAPLQIYRAIVALFHKNPSLDKEAAEKLARDWVRKNSEDWMIENKIAIDILKEKFGDKFRILNWEELLQKDLFKIRMAQVNDLFYNEKAKVPLDLNLNLRSFRDTVRNLAKSFREKFYEEHGIKTASKKELERDIGYFRRIVLEECVARTCLNYSNEIYRGPGNIPAGILYSAYGFPGQMKAVSIGDESEISHVKKVVADHSPHNKQLTALSKSLESSGAASSSAASSSALPLSSLPIPIPQQIENKAEEGGSHSAPSALPMGSFFGRRKTPVRRRAATGPKRMTTSMQLAPIDSRPPAVRVILPDGTRIECFDNSAETRASFREAIDSFRKSTSAPTMPNESEDAPISPKTS